MSGNSAALSCILKKMDELKLQLVETSHQIKIQTLSTEEPILLRQKYVEIIDEWLTINRVCCTLMKLNKDKALMHLEYLNNNSD